jgi:hypothetical protein
MRQKWLLAVLVLSLAVNAGVLGFYGVSKYSDWRQFLSYQGQWLKPGTKPGQLGRMFADLEKSRAPNVDTLHTATRELGLLALEPGPDSTLVNAALDRIARNTREVSRLQRGHMRELFGLYRPEKLEFWRGRMKVEYDSILRADSGTAVQSEEER